MNDNLSLGAQTAMYIKIRFFRNYTLVPKDEAEEEVGKNAI